MAKFAVRGADATTGKDLLIEVDARTPAEAEAIANNRGIVPSSTALMPPEYVFVRMLVILCYALAGVAVAGTALMFIAAIMSVVSGHPIPLGAPYVGLPIAVVFILAGAALSLFRDIDINTWHIRHRA